MSNNYTKLNTVLVRDPRVIIDNERVYSVLKCGKRTNFKSWNSTSVSSSSINFSAPPPSSNIIVDRKISLTLPFRLVVTADTLAAGRRVLSPNNSALRAFPLQSALDNVIMTINNTSITQDFGEIIHSLIRFNAGENLLENAYSRTPTCLDRSQTYADLQTENGNPLGMYGDCNYKDVSGRGGFSEWKVVRNDENDGVNVPPYIAIVDAVVTEQLFMSPLYFGDKNGSGFYNLNSFDMSFNFLNNAGNRMLSHNNDPADSVIASVQFAPNNFPYAQTNPFSYENNQPLLNITYITPDDSLMISPQTPITWPYFNVAKYVTETNAIPYGGRNDIYSNNIQLSTIPRRFYIYARQNNSTLYSNPGYTDTFYGINNISVQFENYTGLLAEASKFQLYEMSRKNHCNLSWSEWNGKNLYKVGGADFNNQDTYGGVGSIICIEFASDIGLDEYNAPGVGNGNYNLQIRCNVENIDPTGNHDNLPVSLYVLVISEGTFTVVQSGSAVTQLSVISSQDVLNARSSPFVDYTDVEDVNGGNFFSGLKKFGKGALDAAQKTNRFLRDTKAISKVSGVLSDIPGPVGSVAGPVHAVSSMLGYGYDNGGVLLGGQRASRSDMRKRLRNL